MWPSHHPLDLTSLLSRHQLMGLACYSSLYTLLLQCILGRSHGTPPPRVEQTDRQTWVKTLPSRTLRIRAVNISAQHTRAIPFPCIGVRMLLSINMSKKNEICSYRRWYCYCHLVLVFTWVLWFLFQGKLPLIPTCACNVALDQHSG